MMPDYYQLLGVSSDATVDDIRKAYRHHAARAHPDRSGSHERMLLVNEAWEVLSHAESRRRYDDVRCKVADVATQTAAKEDAAKAKQKAGDYPKSWVDFEAWLEGITRDFTSAKYSNAGWLGNGPPFYPSVDNSKSGFAFMFLGSILVMGNFILFYQAITGNLEKGLATTIGSIVALYIGAWVGAMAHKGVSTTIKEKALKETKAGKSREMHCAKCGHAFRIAD